MLSLSAVMKIRQNHYLRIINNKDPKHHKTTKEHKYHQSRKTLLSKSSLQIYHQKMNLGSNRIKLLLIGKMIKILDSRSN